MTYRYIATETFRDEYLKHDEKTISRIDDLVASILNDPFNGIGKPEALRFNLSGFWSRRINREDRLIYKVADNTVVLYSCKGHYK